jgi:hypothetical protein
MVDTMGSWICLGNLDIAALKNIADDKITQIRTNYKSWLAGD